jgi:hypothetical protein
LLDQPVWCKSLLHFKYPQLNNWCYTDVNRIFVTGNILGNKLLKYWYHAVGHSVECNQ